jgi:hypothetical protein
MVNGLKAAISSMAAALILGGAALGADPPSIIPAQAPAPADEGRSDAERNENPRLRNQDDEVQNEPPADDDSTAPTPFLTNLLIGKCLAEKSGLFITGYNVQSFTWNPQNPVDRTNGPVTFNDRSNDWQMNQLYLSMGRTVDTSGNSIDIGGKVDFLYGTDAVFTQALGLDGWILGGNQGPGGIFTQSTLDRLAIPQMYAEFFAPVGKGLTVKAGHFYTIIGYEVVTTPDNFFTTLPYTFQYGEPFTHTGVLATQKITDKVLFNGGVVRGWDSWNDNNNALSFLGGVTWTPTSKTNVTLNCIMGPEQDDPFVAYQGLTPAPGQTVSRSLYSLVIQQQISDKIKYVFQHDHGFQDAATNSPHAEWYGVNQYLFYNVSKKFAVGVRGEWFRDDDGVRVGIARNTNTLGPQAYNPAIPAQARLPFGQGTAGANYYEVSLGANYYINNTIILRPEARWDWQTRDNNGGAQATAAYDDQTRSQQFLLGLDLIIKY